MARITFLFKGSDSYISVFADEFHEDGGYLKAYSAHNELVAIVEADCVKAAYLTEDKR